MPAEAPYAPKFRVLGYLLVAAFLPVVGWVWIIWRERRRRREQRREQSAPSATP